MVERSKKVEVYRASDGWRWRARAGNGEVVAVGEAYQRRVDAVKASYDVTGIVATIVDDEPDDVA